MTFSFFFIMVCSSKNKKKSLTDFIKLMRLKFVRNTGMCIWNKLLTLSLLNALFLRKKY